MTKTVRIENADNSAYKVKVEIQEQKWDPDEQALSKEWTTIDTKYLNCPTAMLESYITSTRRIVISESS